MARTWDEEATLEPFPQLVKKSWRKTKISLSVPTVVLYHVGQLDDVLPLLVLLTQFKGLFLQEEGERELLEREKKFDDRWKKAVAAMMSG